MKMQQVSRYHPLLATLHWVLAALYHQFIRKDSLFRRMFFGRRALNPAERK
jgi:cytochrome b561